MNRLPRAIVILGFVSFFTDLSSEMIYPLLPVFLSGVLGAGALALGFIEGIAESTASLFKVASGIWTDRANKRKPFLLFGYGVSSLVRPLIGLAGAWPFVLLMRFMDRIGKGLRTSPRDALVADAVGPGQRGRAYGLHRAMDHAGAVMGPLVAAALLSYAGLSLRHVFLLAAIPALIVMIILSTSVQESRKPADARPKKDFALRGQWKELGRDYKVLLGAILVFTLGNSTDAFLLLRMSDAGVPAAWIAVLWSAHHVVKMVCTYYGGRLSDGFGARTLIVTGWIVYALTYLAFAFANSPTALVVVFLAYGIYFGLTEPSEKSWVADMVPGHLRGTAFGYYHSVIGLGALPASVLFGLIWHSFGASAAFITGSVLAVVASAILLLIPLAPQAAPEDEKLEPSKIPVLE
ncbi:MAG: MFS transporter [Acidobacteriota bacterium]